MTLTDNYWQSSGSSNWHNTANWSLGHVPTNTERAVFNGSYNGGCDLSDAVSCGGIKTESGYSSFIGTNGYAITTQEDMDFGHSGQLDVSNSVMTCGQSFLWASVGSVYTSGPTLIMNGSASGGGNLQCRSSSSEMFNLLQITGGATIVANGYHVRCSNLDVIDGILYAGPYMVVVYGYDLRVYADGEIYSTNQLQMQGTASGYGIKLMAGSLDVNLLMLNHPYSGSTYAPGTYNCDVLIQSWQDGGTGNAVATFTAGVITIEGTLSLKSGPTGPRSITLKTTGTSELRTKGDIYLYCPAAGSGNTIFDFGGTETDWYLSGGVSYASLGGGQLQITPGHGILAFNGSNNQSVDFDDLGVGTLGGYCYIQKTGGTLTFAGGLATGTMIVYSGSDVVFGSNTIVVNYMDVKAGSTVNPGGTTFSASNDYDFDGQDFGSVAPWQLSSGVDARFKNCDIDWLHAGNLSGSAIADRRSRDLGHNISVTFKTYVPPGNSMLAGVE